LISETDADDTKEFDDKQQPVWQGLGGIGELEDEL
jgi:hypothetical protein